MGATFFATCTLNIHAGCATQVELLDGIHDGMYRMIARHPVAQIRRQQ